MNFKTITRRVAATGGVAALAAGALVGATTTAAQAAPISNVYTCGIPGLAGPWDVTLDSDIPGIDNLTSVPAGFDVGAASPAFPQGVQNTFTVPAEAYQALGGFGVEDVSFPDFAGSFGSTDIGVTGMATTVSAMTQNDDGTYSFDADGQNAAFEAPPAGTHQVLAPSDFTMMASTAEFGDVGVPCTLKEGTTSGAYATISTFKTDSTTGAAPVEKTLKTTKVAKMKVVILGGQAPTGKVIVKEGSKKLGSAMAKAGKAVVSMGKLKKGSHTVTVVYKGDGYNNGSKSEPVTFKVKRG